MFFVNQPQKYFYSGVTPLDGVTWNSPPPISLVTDGDVTEQDYGLRITDKCISSDLSPEKHVSITSLFDVFHTGIRELGHLLTPTPYHAAFPRYCTPILKHISDVLSISVAESVLCAMPCKKTV